MYLLDVLEEHAEEAAFLWMMRQLAIRSWKFTPRKLARIDERLAAHLDGLCIGAEAAAEILEPYLTSGEEGEAFAAAYVALASSDQPRQTHVFEAFERAEGETFDGIRHAMRHAASPVVSDRMADYAEADNPRLVAAAIDVMTFRGVRHPFTVLHLLPDRPAMVRAAGLHAVAQVGGRDYLSQVEAALGDQEPAVQRAALAAGFVLQSEKSHALCRELVNARSPNADAALRFLGLAGLREDQAIIFSAVSEPVLGPHAVVALSAHGYTNVVGRLLELSEKWPDQRGVGLVVSRLTGVNIELDDLESWAEVEASRRGEGPTFADLDQEFAGLDVDPYEGLPPPDWKKLAAWWGKNEGRFDPGARLRHGEPLSVELLQQIVENGVPPAQRDAAMELRRLGEHADVRHVFTG